MYQDTRNYTPVSERGKVQLLLPSVMLVLALFPYIQFGPIGLPTEVQPFAALVAWMAAFILLVRGRLALSRFHWVILGFSLLFMFYIPLDDSFEFSQYLRKSTSFFLSAALIVIAGYLSPARILSVLKVSAVVWLIFGVFGTLFPAEYLEVARKLVPGALGAYGDRGTTSLAPEATDYGFTLVYFWVLTLLASGAARARGGKGAPRWLFWVVFVNIALSASGAGLFSLVLVQTVYWMTFNPLQKRRRISVRTLLLGGGLVVSLLIMAATLEETGIRGVDLLLQGIRSPQLLLDSTLSYRLAHNLVGIYGLFESNLMGWGAGSFVVQGQSVYLNSNIESLLGVEGWYRSNIPLTLQVSPLAIFPVIIFEYGIFGVMFILYIFRSVLKSDAVGKYVLATLLFLTWAQSFPSAYPLFWILLGLIRNPDFFTVQTLNHSDATLKDQN